MKHKRPTPEIQMPDQPAAMSKPRRIEPIFDASGTLRRVRIDRGTSNEGTHRPQSADRG
ncbi:MAG TPA: hypothetical protein PKA57_07245 [Parvibaculum sp.]|uniref:hypothetical protein n=1 Tax=Parvibaculum sp. TaxID=2024848 RepID=UPI002CAF5213|nr:hypothetical protein [Parvibaculum sp.]HMM14411.1 hypothetical protein [Parvibaculum sp.]